MPHARTWHTRLFAQGWTGWTGCWTGWLASEGGPSSRGPKLDIRWQWAVNHLQHACTVVPVVIINSHLLKQFSRLKSASDMISFISSAVQTWQSSIDSIPPHTTPSCSTARFSDYMSTRGCNSTGSELRWRSAACRSLGSALANHTSEAASHRNQAHKNHPIPSKHTHTHSNKR